MQSSFLGGAWSAYYQGRADDPRYRTALAQCVNSFPLEEGCWTRRPGFRWLGTTRNGVQAIVKQFHFDQAHPYVLEFTPGHLRMWSGVSLVTAGTPLPIIGISAAGPAVVTTASAHNLTSGQQIRIAGTSAGTTYGVAPLLNRTFAVTVTSTTTFTIYDPITGTAFNGSGIALGSNALTVNLPVDFTTPYTAAQISANQIQVVQAIDITTEVAVILCPGVQPYSLTCTQQETGVYGGWATFTFNPTVLLDGPYLDFVNDGSTVSNNADAGVVTWTIAYAAYSSGTTYALGANVVYGGVPYTSLQDNNLGNTPAPGSAYWQDNAAGLVSVNQGRGFLSTDVGRAFRAFAEPAVWNSSTAYSYGMSVKYNGEYYSVVQGEGSVNAQPDISPTHWAINTSCYGWAWGRIVAVVNTNQIQVQMVTPTILTGTFSTWQVGAYTNTLSINNALPTWPSCGVYHEGRLWLSGAIANRVDASTTDDVFTFSPTGIDGTVSDDNGISETFNSAKVNATLWMTSEAVGIVAGTQAGEWLIQASALNDPLTPTSIQAHMVTRFGCDPVVPVQCPLSVVFVQRYGRRMIEYIADVYSGKFSGTDIAIQAKHFTQTGIVELAYCQEKTPVIWARMTDGSLCGCTYKRESPFGTQPASFSGWHQHPRLDGRTYASITAGPSQGGNLDSLTVVTGNGTTTGYFVELMTDLFDQNTTINLSWFLDASSPPTGVYLDQTTNPATVRLYGYSYLAGQSVDVWAAGLDMGTYTVSATGEIDLTIGTPALFTLAYLQTLTAEGNVFGAAGLSVQALQGPPAATPPATNAVQSFTASGGNGYSAGGNFYWDFGNNTVYLYSGQANATSGASYYNFSTVTGSQTDRVAGAGVATAQNVNQFYAFCIGTDGNYYTMGTAVNYGIMVRLNPTTYAQLAYDTNTSTSSSRVNSYSVATPKTIAPFALNGRNFLCLTSQGSISDGVTIYDADNMVTLGYYPQTQQQIYTAFGNLFQYGQYQVQPIYTISGAPTGTFNNINIGCISVTEGVSAGAITIGNNASLYTIPYTAFGAGTSVFQTTPGFLLFDRADGNVISSVVLANSQTWFFKVNMATGALLWTLQIPSGMAWSDTGNAFGASLINGYMPLIEATNPYTVLWVNTLTGAIISTPATINHFGFGGYAYNGNTNQLFFTNAGLSTGSGGPTPLNSTPATFTGQAAMMYGLPPTNPVTYFGPFLAGHTYTSQGQLLTVVTAQDSGARNGPAVGKTNRAQEIAFNLYNCQGMSFGTDFTLASLGTSGTMYPMNFCNNAGVTLPLNVLYSGIYWDKIEDTYDFYSQPAWQITRPYPATVTMIEAFIHTQDR